DYSLLTRNYPISNLINTGYQIVYNQLYSHYTSSLNLMSAKSICNYNSILCAGGSLANSDILELVACGNCFQVLTNTTSNSPNLVGTVYWYMTSPLSFGFSPIFSITQSSADTYDKSDPFRLSWHLDQTSGGYREKMSDKKFHARSTAMEVIEGHDLTGYEIIITGTSTGIGVETARALAKVGARLVLAARDMTKLAQVADDLKQTTGNDKIEIEKLELDSLESVNELVKRYLAKDRPLNILINNAGIMACPLSYTKDGFELQLGTNHIGHFVLTLGLIPALKRAAELSGRKSRVISLSSIAHAMSDFNFDDP
ncbi:unnamed protein product, partial [Brachionus calyciflorus]